jgi:hypothetical protein
MGFGNNVVSALAADINATQTTIAVMPGGGALFAACLTTERENSSNPLSVYAKITLMDEEETVYEICHLTAVTGDVLTVIRGQEATTAKGWSLNDRVANFATRGSENNFVQIAQLQSGQYTSAIAGGTANALTVDLPSAYFVNGATDWQLKAPLIVIPAFDNTGASTIQLTLAGTVVGIFPIYKGNKSPVDAGDLLAGVPICCLLDTSKTFFNVINPVAAYSGTIKTVNGHGPDSAGAVAVTSQDIFSGQAIGLTADIDLNTLTTPGIYYNPSNANATPGKNYPGTNAGSLLVLKDAGFTQIYTEYNGGQQYRRGYYGDAWGSWLQLYDSVHKPPTINAYTKSESDGRYPLKDGTSIIGFDSGNVEKPYLRHTESDVVVHLARIDYAYSKAESDAKYVHDVQLGAEISVPNDTSIIHAGQGSFWSSVNRDHSGADDLNWYSKPIQININGVWHTITG